MGQLRYVPSEENLQKRVEFKDSKFGIFIHWGIYSMFGQGEWYMNENRINCYEYAKAASGFYPSRFNAKEWVSAIKEAGAKYICFTSRHHDGFSMFDTQFSDYDIIDASPFKRDIVKELAEECHKQGIKIHLYYSLIDWTREDFYPLGKSGHYTGRVKHGKWDDYFNFMKNQLTELLTNYGTIDAIWFDGVWDQPDTFDWRLEELYSLIHKLQPACLIGNNHHKKPFDGEDFQMFERDLPGENKSGFSHGTEIGNLPLETCETMNGMWGYKIEDQNYKSVSQIVRLLVRSAGKGANLLLNVGPQPNGEIPEMALERFKGVGEWLKKYGYTIYGTEQGGIESSEWGVTTRKDNILYIHVLSDVMPQYIVIPIKDKITNIENINTGLKVPYERIKNGLVLNTKELKPDIDCIIKVSFK